MALFQQSVIKKYIGNLDEHALKAAWLQYQAHFHNAYIQKNIWDAKEEEYQEGFVRDLFVSILGYTLKPQPNYNLVLEKKTETDATKSDGALLRDDSIIGVIELKDTGTTELVKIEKQVFGYKHKHKNCVYVITSNFEKLRFYINDATDFEEFNLFTLTQQRFAVLYLCLQQQSIQNDVPLKMKQASISEEENVTKKLYADYSGFKKELFASIAALNPQYHKLELFKKTQKLLDRLLFVLFAEDRGLLPPNSVREILSQWQQLKELDNYVSLYSRFIKYFGYLNTGHSGKHYDIFAYNGGLFAPDDILDNILIDDNLLHKGGLTLSKYDFDSEVDVNILGHIFEHSLGEIEEVQAALEGTAIDKTKTKRKKDGVFYTPRYITKYMVENTVGTLCSQQKQTMGIQDDAFTPQKRKANTKQLQQQLDDYRQWLLQITICDPACGSGAFLNQALEFLIAEHRLIDELTAKLFGDAMVLTDVENSILENNIFGVDINDEAVEIARLSLWLRTARKGRKLNSLNANIKVGNSLIDDPAIAGDKAFNWQQEFKPIFDRGGFDVVIGNPPYATKIFSDEDIKSYKRIYETAEYQLDLYILFIEKSVKILKSKIALITPNSWLKNMTMSECRKYLLANIHFNIIVANLPKVFEDASVDSLIFIGSKESSDKEISIQTIEKNEFLQKHTISQSVFVNNQNSVFTVEADERTNKILAKMRNVSSYLKDFFEITRGVNPYDAYRGQSKEIIESKAYHSNFKKDDTYLPEIRGKNIGRFFYQWDGESYISYGPWLAAPRDPKFFKNERIVFRQVLGDRLICTVINDEIIIDQSIFIALPKIDSTLIPKFVITLLASKLGSFYFRYSSNEFDALFPKIKLGEFSELPIRVISDTDQLPFVAKAEIMLSKNKELQQVKQQLQQLLLGKYNSLKLNNKLTNWPALSFNDFLKELTKQKIKLSLPEEAGWLSYFGEQKNIANNIEQVIAATDKKIDRMVYALYGLTEEEIKIVEAV